MRGVFGFFFPLTMPDFLGLSEILQTQVVPVNKPGGGASIGADFVAKSKKDGYTILYANSNSSYEKSFYSM